MIALDARTREVLASELRQLSARVAGAGELSATETLRALRRLDQLVARARERPLDQRATVESMVADVDRVRELVEGARTGDASRGRLHVALEELERVRDVLVDLELRTAEG